MSSSQNSPPPTPSSTRRPSFSLPFPPISAGPITLAATQSFRRQSIPGSTQRPRADSLSSLSSSLASSIPPEDVPVVEEENDEGLGVGSVKQKIERRMSLGRTPRPVMSPTITRGFFLDPTRTRRQSISMPVPEETPLQQNSGRPIPPPPQRRATIHDGSAAQDIDPLQERILKGDFYMDCLRTAQEKRGLEKQIKKKSREREEELRGLISGVIWCWYVLVAGFMMGNSLGDGFSGVGSLDS